jgi:hypothetical protein
MEDSKEQAVLQQQGTKIKNIEDIRDRSGKDQEKRKVDRM